MLTFGYINCVCLIIIGCRVSFTFWHRYEKCWMQPKNESEEGMPRCERVEFLQSFFLSLVVFEIDTLIFFCLVAQVDDLMITAFLLEPFEKLETWILHLSIESIDLFSLECKSNCCRSIVVVCLRIAWSWTSQEIFTINLTRQESLMILRVNFNFNFMSSLRWKFIWSSHTTHYREREGRFKYLRMEWQIETIIVIFMWCEHVRRIVVRHERIWTMHRAAKNEMQQTRKSERDARKITVQAAAAAGEKYDKNLHSMRQQITMQMCSAVSRECEIRPRKKKQLTTPSHSDPREDRQQRWLTVEKWK